jgi:D-alanyl-D-alanine carboxypeptidase/D-alanyl-D-alanine-endopeptidase (penicillin-binding protein 4)
LFQARPHILCWSRGGFIPIIPLLFLCLLLLNSCGKPLSIELPTAQEEKDALHQLQTEIAAVLGEPPLASSNVGIKVVSVTTGEVLYDAGADKLYHPASTMKLLTSATALEKLRPNYRFHTTLYAEGIEGARVRENLYLKGRGDPLFDIEDLAKMVKTLVQSGVEEIEGDIVVDDTYFDNVPKGKGWMWDDGPIGGYYSHQSALTVNHNGVKVTVSPGAEIGGPVNVRLDPFTAYVEVLNDAVTVGASESGSLLVERQTKPVPANVLTIRGFMPVSQEAIRRRVDIVNPALFCGTLFREALTRNGVSVQGVIRQGAVPDGASEIAVHTSLPLSLIVRRMNKRSDNLIAELLLKTLGAEVIGAVGTSQKGLRVINEFLSETGIATTQSTLADGSGVSRYNLLSASMLTNLLVRMFHDFSVMPEYVMSLPVAGVDGTLSWRMKESESEGVLRAKTGTMRGITTLAGYAMTADGEILAFAMLMSNYVGSSNPRRALQDRIGNILTRFSRLRGE